MREILFRGKRIEDGQWVEGHYHFANWYLPPSMEIVDRTHHILQIGRGDAAEIDPETVGQFTGLTDKNGNKIFEGDIVRYMNKETMVVVWNKDSASFAIAYSAINFNYLATISSAHIYLEVIGNIHDNPELLKEE